MYWAQVVRLRSQQRNARPAGVVDDLIRQIQARQRSTTPSKQRANTRREEEERAASSDDAGGEAGGTQRRKKRGSGGHKKSTEVTAPSHLHLMYREEEEGLSNREPEDEVRSAPDA